MRAEVALYDPSRAALLLDPRPGRWPEHEAADRLAIGVGLAALAAGTADDARLLVYRDALTRLAMGISAAGGDPLPADVVPLAPFGLPRNLAVVPWEGPGRARVEADVIMSRTGVVPRLHRRPEAVGPATQVAALAALVALAADADAAARVDLAVTIEGLVSWYRESHRLSPPRHALAFALAHARDRLAEAGRTLPPGL